MCADSSDRVHRRTMFKTRVSLSPCLNDEGYPFSVRRDRVASKCRCWRLSWGKPDDEKPRDTVSQGLLAGLTFGLYRPDAGSAAC